jgi:hypothetical protein
VCLSSGYKPVTANPPALRSQLHTPLLSALVAATFYCDRRATCQEPQFLQHNCLLSLSEAHTHKISNDSKISLLKGKDNYAIWLIDIRAILRSKNYWNLSLLDGNAEIAIAAAAQLQQAK